MLRNKNKGFSLVELIVVIAILVVFAAILIPSLLQYTENSRAQKDESAMDEVVNAVQLAMADQDCYDEMLQYSCTNNYITYTDSSGVYGQVIADGEFWAPDGSGRATTITFNPEIGPNGDTIYNLDTAIVNDMTYGNGSVAQDRTMEGALIENNQCYFKNASINSNTTSYTYNKVRQTIGDSLITTSATYRNSSFTIFIKFSQKDNITVADVNGSFNGTNLYEGAVASKGSGTFTYGNDGNAITTVTTPGTIESECDSTDLIGGGEFYPEYTSGGTIPDNGQYVTKDGDVLEPGETMRKPKTGDIYKDEYYEYRYNQYCNSSSGTNKTWKINESQNGWGVRVLDVSLENYGTIQPELGGKKVNTLYFCFSLCNKMTAAPVLHEGITNMYCAFYQCKALVKAPEIPNGVLTLQSTFKLCESLTIPPSSIPESVTDLTYTFSNCKKLQYSPDIPSSVTKMNGTYYKCAAIVDLSNVTIPSKVTTLYALCEGCTNLKYAPDMSAANQCTDIMDLFRDCSSLIEVGQLPANATKMSYAFDGCKSLKDFPAIPVGVTSLWRTFALCELMEVAPVIPEGVTSMYQAFNGCTNLKTVQNLPNSLTTLSNAFYKCTSLETVPAIPSKVQNMEGTFAYCTSLTGEIQINTTKITSTGSGFWGDTTGGCGGCFNNTTQPIKLVGSTTAVKTLLASTAKNGNVTY